MHPELLGALARQRVGALTSELDSRRRGRERSRPDRRSRRAVSRARWHLGAALMDVGLHLMSRSVAPQLSSPAERRAA